MARRPNPFQYTEEREFEDEYLVPKLNRMGFQTVRHYHGACEFGKDLVVLDQTRFKEPFYCGIQTKYEHIRLDGTVESVIQDANQAFANPFKTPTGEDGYISHFYVLNGRRVSQQAETHFYNTLKRLHGPRISIYSAENLLAIVEVDTLVLKGLLLEIDTNTDKIKTFLNDPDPLVTPKFREDAVTQFLLRPGVDELIVLATNYQASLDNLNGALPKAAEMKPIERLFQAVDIAAIAFKKMIIEIMKAARITVPNE